MGRISCDDRRHDMSSCASPTATGGCIRPSGAANQHRCSGGNPPSIRCWAEIRSLPYPLMRPPLLIWKLSPAIHRPALIPLFRLCILARNPADGPRRPSQGRGRQIVSWSTHLKTLQHAKQPKYT